MRSLFRLLLPAILFTSALAVSAADPTPIKVLIIDGQNNHKWQETTPVLKSILEKSGRFTVDVATTPPKGDRMTFCSR